MMIKTFLSLVVVCTAFAARYVAKPGSTLYSMIVSAVRIRWDSMLIVRIDRMNQLMDGSIASRIYVHNRRVCIHQSNHSDRSYSSGS